jgi:hypothetical protein
MKETVISFTAVNIVTVCVMLILGSAVIGAILKAIAKARQSKGE